jgi:type IV pilus assembly protein PilB
VQLQEGDRRTGHQTLLDAGFSEADSMAAGPSIGPGSCERCKGSGYKGRVGIYQVMPVSEAIQRLIMNGATSNWIWRNRRRARG